MIDVFLDPYVLAVPPGDASVSVVQRYVDALGEWEVLCREKKVKIWKSKDTDEAIYFDAAFPTHNDLQVRLRHWCCHHLYNADFILRTVEKLLQNASVVETFLDIEAFSTDEVEQVPASLFTGRPEQFVSHCETVAMLALLHGIAADKSPVSQPVLAMRDSPVDTSTATFKGHVQWIKSGFQEQHQTLSGEISLYSSAFELRRQITPHEDQQDFWTLSEDNGFIKGIASITPDLLNKVDRAKRYLSRSPMQPHGNTVKLLTGNKKGQWRYRIGDYRLVYEPDPELKRVSLIDFGPRGGVYD